MKRISLIVGLKYLENICITITFFLCGTIELYKHYLCIIKTNKSRDRWVKAEKQNFFTYDEKVTSSAGSQLQQLLEEKQASSSSPPPFILSQLFFSPDGGQSSEAAAC